MKHDFKTQVGGEEEGGVSEGGAEAEGSVMMVHQRQESTALQVCVFFWFSLFNLT